MRCRWRMLSLLFTLLVCLMMVAPAGAANTGYRTALTRWRAAGGGFGSWQRSGVELAADGTLLLDLQGAAAEIDPYPSGGYYEHNYYNGGSFRVGEVVSPATTARFSFSEAIASWNADTPPGTWIETQIRARIGERWTKWYVLGIWAADTGTVERHSVRRQGDDDGFVAVDTLVLEQPTNVYQLKLRLFSADNNAVPTVRNLSLAYSTSPAKPEALAPGNPRFWNRVLSVPECSQMVYPDGGEVWCSPTSTSMVLGYWTQDSGPCAPRVRAAVDGVYDWLYDGHGNWPFNTAYAATRQMEGYVVRFRSMAQLEPWIAAGVPVVISFAWAEGELTGAAIPSSEGHLAVVVGFDAAGNPVVNDPAAANDASVQRTYLRSELEPLWLEHSGGTAYLIFPAGQAVPNL